MKIVTFDKEDQGKSNGITVYNERLYAYLTSLGHNIFNIRFTNNKYEQSNIFPLPYYLESKKIHYVLLPSPTTGSRIHKYLEHIKPDIVYAPLGLSIIDFLLPSICHKLHIPIASISHSDFNNGSFLYKLLMQPAYTLYTTFCQQVDLLQVFTPQLKDFYVKQKVDSKKIFVLSNGVNTSLYTPGNSSFAKKNAFQKGVLFMGRLTAQKNPELLIKTFLKLPFSETKLIIIGNGDQEKRLRNIYKNSRIIFTGLITNEEEKIDIMRSCQVFVLPSQIEGSSLALLEAMSCGLYCIASTAGANAALLENAGICISTNRFNQELRPTLSDCLNNPNRTYLWGKKAREKAVKIYDNKIIFDQLLEKIEKTIADYRNH